MNSCYFQKKVTKGTLGGYYYVESSGYRRYVCFWDVRKRKIPVLFSNLPVELNKIIWHYKRQLECSEKRWDNFLMDLTTHQYHDLKKKVKAHTDHVRVAEFIGFALRSFPANSRIYKKAAKQLLNY